MKKYLGALTVVVVMTLLLSGCAVLYPVGSLYTGVKMPLIMGDGKDVTYTKVGKSSSTSILTLFAVGDGSMEAAVKNGGIKTVKYVDYHADNFLGIYGKYTTTVYGD